MQEQTCGLEVKLVGPGAGPPVLSDGTVIEGYASLFGQTDQGGDVVVAGAYAKSLSALAARGGKVRMLWQHDPARPIGVWEEIREDTRGLWVKGRLLPEVAQAREAAALIAAGALDGLSIGFRTVEAARDQKGRRLLTEIELWEVSLVTFPMLPAARLMQGKGDVPEAASIPALAGLFAAAAQALRAAREAGPSA